MENRSKERDNKSPQRPNTKSYNGYGLKALLHGGAVQCEIGSDNSLILRGDVLSKLHFSHHDFTLLSNERLPSNLFLSSSVSEQSIGYFQRLFELVALGRTIIW